MLLTELIKQYKSTAIVGMAKNTGKTTCLNYLLKKFTSQNLRIAVTSIGVDGEERDILYNTLKPRITIYKDNIFVTSEKHYNEKQIDTNILSTSKQHTALGQLITAQALTTGQVILSGPSDAALLSHYLTQFDKMGVQLSLIDGALNRMSLASPSVTEAMVLCTGAACSKKFDELLKKVKYRCELINLPQTECNIANTMEGVWGIVNSESKKVATSLFENKINPHLLLKQFNTVYISGAVTDTFMKSILKENIEGFTIIANDFTRIFLSPATYYKYIKRGGSLKVKQKSNLIAICSNPTSPEGHHYEPNALKDALSKQTALPVFDIFQEA